MIKRQFGAYFLIVTFAIGACSTTHKKTNVSWPEMNAFHKVMAQVYHPFMDSANLKPARSHADDVEASARAWEASVIPEGIESVDEVKLALSQLRMQAEAMAALVETGAGDVPLGDSLTAIHKSFHRIMESVEGADKDEHKKE